MYVHNASTTRLFVPSMFEFTVTSIMNYYNVLVTASGGRRPGTLSFSSAIARVKGRLCSLIICIAVVVPTITLGL